MRKPKWWKKLWGPATVEIPNRTANDLGEMISSYLGNGVATVGRKFALAMAGKGLALVRCYMFRRAYAR